MIPSRAFEAFPGIHRRGSGIRRAEAVLLPEKERPPMGVPHVDRTARLEQENEDYRRLKARHHDFDLKLQRLSDKRILTDEEKLQEVRMKKEKLFLKDQMSAIERDQAASMIP